MDTELADLSSVPWEREGALLDEIRKDGIADETVEKAVVLAVRLLKGVEGEFSRELVEKLGVELYGRPNPKLNSKAGESYGGLVGTSDAPEDDQYGEEDGPDKDGDFDSDYELFETGENAPKVASDADGDDKEPDDDPDDMKKDAKCDDDMDEDDMKKAELDTEHRRQLARRGHALPDGSFPIRNKSDLSNAISAYGRAGNKPRAKAWIIRRARALGATGMLPDKWKVSKSDDIQADEVVNDEGGTVEIQVPVRKEDGTWDLSGVPSDSRPFFEEVIQKADETQRELKETREQLQKADDALLTREMVEKAASFSHVAPSDELAPILKEARLSMDEESFGKLEALLSAAEERITKGSLFQEMGRASYSGSPEKASDAYAEAVQKADELIEKSDKAMTSDQALARVWENNPDLYTRYLAENGMGVS